MEILTTKTFRELRGSGKKIKVFQGGARSGKTYNIIFFYVFMCIKFWRGKIITVCRETMPSLRGTAMRDFINIMYKLNRFNERMFNKSTNEYYLNGNIFEFISIDQPQKIKGRKRDELFMNEANEIDYEGWMQLLLRTEGGIVLDYNPSMIDHWIYDEVLVRDDVDFFHSTYKDNPFLSKELVAEIERLQKVDDNYWKIYGLGERGELEGVIFKNWRTVDVLPEGRAFYGLDFGFTNDPTACVKVVYNTEGIYVRELIYERGLTNRDIKRRFRDKGIGVSEVIIADSAEPKSIMELRLGVGGELGYNVRGVDKGPDSVKKGIDLLLQFPIYVTKDSINLIKELRNYKWERKRDERGYLNKPVDAFNHAIDALRYGCMMNIKRYHLSIL